MEKSSFYHRHLYWETRPQTKEYNIMYCYNILGIIARLQDRIINNLWDKSYCDKQEEKIKRLQSYYNYRLKLVKNYE